MTVSPHWGSQNKFDDVTQKSNWSCDAGNLRKHVLWGESYLSYIAHALLSLATLWANDSKIYSGCAKLSTLTYFNDNETK